MDNTSTFKIDSKGAQRDLDALAAALDRASMSAGKMDRQFANAANSADRNLRTASKAMERYAQIATLLSKIRFAGDSAGQIAKFGEALDKLGRARAVKPETIKGFVNLIDVAARAQRIAFNPAFGNSIRDIATAMDALGRARPLRAETLRTFTQLIEVVGRAQRVRLDPGFAASLKNIGGAMDYVARARTIRPSALKSFVDFIEIAARSQRLRFNPQTAQALRDFGRSIGMLKAPTGASIERLEKMFVVLGNARRIPNAAAIARDLDMVAAAAGRASAALGNLPARLRNTGNGAINRNLRETAAGANAASAGFRAMGASAAQNGRHVHTLGERLRGLNHRFSASYQFGTLFTTMFSAFTFGGFVKGIYEASIGLAKLDKAMLFATKSVEGGNRASQEFIATAFTMGLNLETAIEAYGRFAISASAAGLAAGTTKQVFDSVARTLQIVGASAQQQEYAFYGLTQMIQKGKVSSEEFNRQIGEQIPGNAAAGARAMSEILGRRVEIAEFFELMRKGQIMSAQFVPAYARQLDQMFGGMNGLLDARPDIAVARLQTAFTIFQQEVGKNGFMQEVGQQLNRLAALFGKVEDGVFTLNPKAKELAEIMGRGLARAARMVGDALTWAFENMDKLVTAGKAVAVLVIGNTFMGWGRSALEATANMMKMVLAMRAVKAEAAVTAGTQAASGMGLAGASTAEIMADRNRRGIAPRGVGGAASRGAAFASVGITGANAFARPAGATGEGVRQFGRRIPAAARAADLAATGAGVANIGAAATGSAAKVGILTTAVRGLSLAFGVVGVTLTALIALMAIFSDKQTDLGGKSVQFGDILAGAFGHVGDSVGKFFMDSVNAFSGVESKQGDFQKSAGRMALSVIAAVVSIGKMFITVFTSIGKLIGTIVANTIIPFIAGWEKLKKGDIIGAGADFASELFVGSADRMMALGAEVGRDFAGASPFAVYDDMQNRAQASAAAREAADGATDSMQAAKEQAEAALRQQQAADAQAEAAGRQIDAARRMQEAMTPPSWSELRGRIGALVSGDFAAANRNRRPIGPAAAGVPAPTMPGAIATGADGNPVLNSGLMSTARGFVGLNENRDRTQIASFLRENAGVNIDPAITAWCAAFVNAVLGANGMSGTNSLAARSFMSYGSEVRQDQAQVGDIAVFRRGNNPAQGHVGFFQGYDEQGNVRILGGNQGRAGGVTETTMARSDLLSIRRASGGGAGGVGGSGMAAAGDDDVEKAYNQGMNDWKSLQTFMARSDPASAALAQIASRLEPLRDIIDRDEARVANGQGSLFTPENVAEMDRAMAKQVRDLADAVNPFAAMTRQTGFSNDLMASSLAGGNDSTYAWREAVNGLREQGYDVEDMQDEAAWQERINRLLGEGHGIQVQTLADAQVAFELARQRTLTLEAEVDLLRTRNELTVQNIADTGSRRDGIFAALVNASSDVGSYEDKLATLNPERRSAMMANAEAQDLAAATAAARGIRVEMSELLSTERLGDTAASFRDNYKSALEQLTGLSGRTLDQLRSQASASQLALADEYATLIQRIENPPGFQAWIDGLMPFEERLQKIKFDFVEGLSEGITGSLMGEDVDWKGMFKGLRRDWLKGQVDEQLKGVMGFLGIGKTEAATPEAQALVDAGGNLNGAAQALTTAAGAISAAATGQSSAASTAIGAIQSVATGGAASGAPAMAADAYDEWMAAGGSASGIAQPTSATDFSGLRAPAASVAAANDNAPAASMMSSIFGAGADGQNNSPLSWVGQLFGKGNNAETRGSGLMGALAMGGTIYDLLKGGKDKKPERQWSIGDVNGLLNAPGAVETTGTEVAAKSNIIADIANMAMSAYTGGFGQGGGWSVGKTFGNMGSAMGRNNSKIGSMFAGFFEEGGLSSAPVKAAAFHPSIWANAPHYAEGVENTSGGMPAILHPNEAVIPLSRGRKVPVEMAGGGGNTTVNSNVTIVANDPNEFRASRSALARKQARTLKQAAVRNLNPL